VTEIHELLNIEQSTTSHHLGILKDKGVLLSKRDGKNTYYFLKHNNLRQIVECVSQCCDRWSANPFLPTPNHNTWPCGSDQDHNRHGFYLLLPHAYWFVTINIDNLMLYLFLKRGIRYTEDRGINCIKPWQEYALQNSLHLKWPMLCGIMMDHVKMFMDTPISYM